MPKRETVDQQTGIYQRRTRSADGTAEDVASLLKASFEKFRRSRNLQFQLAEAERVAKAAMASPEKFLPVKASAELRETLLTFARNVLADVVTIRHHMKVGETEFAVLAGISLGHNRERLHVCAFGILVTKGQRAEKDRQIATSANQNEAAIRRERGLAAYDTVIRKGGSKKNAIKAACETSGVKQTTVYDWLKARA